MQTMSLEAAYALKFINQTHCSVFLTGKAGTGKTTLLKKIIASTHKNTVVVAPTGIAALNAGGVTIHSMFQLPFNGFIPVNHPEDHFSETLKFETKDTLGRSFKMSSLKKAVIRNMELLIIDEVSMLRADLLDAIDFTIQKIRGKSIAFGGVQVVFIGDLLQLPPIIREEEWDILQNYYKGKFFFNAHVIEQNPPLYIELSKVFRQTDDQFLDILNHLRNNQMNKQHIKILNQYVCPHFDFKKNAGYITLTTHNAKADTMNAKALAELPGKTIGFDAEIVGDFPDKIYPLDPNLRLKIGAQIMFVKNDNTPEKHYFNGKMGVIQALSEREIQVLFEEENKTITVERSEWQNIRYFIDPNTKEIGEEILGTFTQYPIKLAWAITVHKSQGLTFNKAALDVSQVFLPGQAYVALSRLRSLTGLVLLSPLQLNGIANDTDVLNYSHNKASEQILERTLTKETKTFIYTYIKRSFDWLDLAKEWRKHQYSYDQSSISSESTFSAEKTKKSEKIHYYHWAKEQTAAIMQLIPLAQKFMTQLDALFQNNSLDFQAIQARIDAAYTYFFPRLDQLLHTILYTLECIKRLKKSKTFFNELCILEEFQTNAIFRLMKAKQLINIVITKQEICKENLDTVALTTYIQNKQIQIKTEIKQNYGELLTNEASIDRYTKKNTKTTAPKKSTVQQTFELWQQDYSIEEIAELRKLTISTICDHFAKLIVTNQVSLPSILPLDKVEQLNHAFQNHSTAPIAVLKAKYGEQFTWDELRLFKASLSFET